MLLIELSADVEADIIELAERVCETVIVRVKRGDDVTDHDVVGVMESDDVLEGLTDSEPRRVPTGEPVCLVVAVTLLETLRVPDGSEVKDSTAVEDTVKVIGDDCEYVVVDDTELDADLREDGVELDDTEGDNEDV